MGNLFKKPKMPEMPKVDPLPTESSESVQERMKKALADLRARRSRSSTLFGGGTNPMTNPAPATKSLGRARLAA